MIATHRDIERWVCSAFENALATGVSGRKNSGLWASVGDARDECLSVISQALLKAQGLGVETRLLHEALYDVKKVMQRLEDSLPVLDCDGESQDAFALLMQDTRPLATGQLRQLVGQLRDKVCGCQSLLTRTENERNLLVGRLSSRERIIAYIRKTLWAEVIMLREQLHQRDNQGRYEANVFSIFDFLQLADGDPETAKKFNEVMKGSGKDDLVARLTREYERLAKQYDSAALQHLAEKAQLEESITNLQRALAQSGTDGDHAVLTSLEVQERHFSGLLASKDSEISSLTTANEAKATLLVRQEAEFSALLSKWDSEFGPVIAEKEKAQRAAEDMRKEFKSVVQRRAEAEHKLKSASAKCQKLDAEVAALKESTQLQEQVHSALLQDLSLSSERLTAADEARAQALEEVAHLQRQLENAKASAPKEGKPHEESKEIRRLQQDLAAHHASVKSLELELQESRRQQREAAVKATTRGNEKEGTASQVPAQALETSRDEKPELLVAEAKRHEEVVTIKDEELKAATLRAESAEEQVAELGEQLNRVRADLHRRAECGATSVDNPLHLPAVRAEIERVKNEAEDKLGSTRREADVLQDPAVRQEIERIRAEAESDSKRRESVLEKQAAAAVTELSTQNRRDSALQKAARHAEDLQAEVARLAGLLEKANAKTDELTQHAATLQHKVDVETSRQKLERSHSQKTMQALRDAHERLEQQLHDAPVATSNPSSAAKDAGEGGGSPRMDSSQPEPPAPDPRASQQKEALIREIRDAIAQTVSPFTPSFASGALFSCADAEPPSKSVFFVAVAWEGTPASGLAAAAGILDASGYVLEQQANRVVGVFCSAVVALQWAVATVARHNVSIAVASGVVADPNRWSAAAGDVQKLSDLTPPGTVTCSLRAASAAQLHVAGQRELLGSVPLYTLEYGVVGSPTEASEMAVVLGDRPVFYDALSDGGEQSDSQAAAKQANVEKRFRKKLPKREGAELRLRDFTEADVEAVDAKKMPQQSLGRDADTSVVAF
ncbi:hypothetical protein DIPPA_05179 [Diplonema papillatum]|nr:hypothetical protein DIPPA_05179 [Diplonema papillatum]